MRSLIKIFLLLSFLSNFTLLNAEIVNKIEILGNKRVSDETVKVYSGIDDNKRDYLKSDLDQILKNIYDTNFFSNVSVKIENEVLIINLKEYPIINQLIFLGEKIKKIKEQIKKIISFKEKDSFIQNNLNND